MRRMRTHFVGIVVVFVVVSLVVGQRPVRLLTVVHEQLLA
jgi:hypothetical protein